MICLLSIVGAGLFVVQPATDPFRYPKDLLLRAVAILLAGAWLITAIGGKLPRLQPRDKPPLIFSLVVLGWTAVTSLTSTNRSISVASLGWVAAVALVLVTLYLSLASRRQLLDVWFLLLPAVANAVIAVLQARGIWTPFPFSDEVPDRLRITALIGNPNDTGTWLVAPMLLAVAVAIVSKRYRLITLAAASVIVAGLLATQTTTAIVGCAAGLLALTISGARNRRAMIAIMAMVLVAITVAIGVVGKVTRDDLIRLKRIEVLNEAVSYRIPPLLAAWRMFLDRPMVGLGPGTAGPSYFDYKIAVEWDHPALFQTGQGWSNFGEMHNDHVEILAETGAPGYLLFLTAIAATAWLSLRREAAADTEAHLTARAARIAALPIAVALFVVCLAQFPMQLTSGTMSFGFVFAAVWGWRA